MFTGSIVAFLATYWIALTTKWGTQNTLQFKPWTLREFRSANMMESSQSVAFSSLKTWTTFLLLVKNKRWSNPWSLAVIPVATTASNTAPVDDFTNVLATQEKTHTPSILLALEEKLFFDFFDPWHQQSWWIGPMVLQDIADGLLLFVTLRVLLLQHRGPGQNWRKCFCTCKIEIEPLV